MAGTENEKALFVEVCVYYILIISQRTRGLSLLQIQVSNYHQSKMFLIDFCLPEGRTTVAVHRPWVLPPTRHTNTPLPMV